VAILLQVGDGLECFHRVPAGRKRRQKGNPVSNERVRHEPESDSLARPSSTCMSALGADLLVREGVP
jgi:hypothetical protein